MRHLLAFPLLFIAVSASAATVTVGCPGGTPGTYPSITAALAALDTQGPNTIQVSGTCNETVTIDQRERLTIQGPATIVGAQPIAAINVRASGLVTLRHLDVTGANNGIRAENESNVAIAGVTAVATATGGNAVHALGSSLTLGGANAADAVLLHNSTTGLRGGGSEIFVAGRVTVENNSSSGIAVESGRLDLLGQNASPLFGGPNTIRNNFNGITGENGARIRISRSNLIQNNGSNGVLVHTNSTLHLDGANGATIIEGHPRSGVGAIFNATFRSNGPNLIRNNGVATDPFRAGISLSHNSMAWIGSGMQITGTTGRGILADSGTTVRLDNTTIDGSTEHGIVLVHGAILESIGGNTVTANGSGSVSCDATAIVFGDFAGWAAFECEKKSK